MTGVAAPRRAGKIIVGIADVQVSGAGGGQLVTYGLGSCLGIVIYDPVVRVGGMLHAMLPSGSADPDKAAANPARFVDRGLPVLFKSAYALGASKERIHLTVAGGAAMNAGVGEKKDFFKIGKRNYLELKKMLWKNGVVIRDEDVGGSISRTMTLDLPTGEVTVKTGGEEYTLSRRFPRRS